MSRFASLAVCCVAVAAMGLIVSETAPLSLSIGGFNIILTLAVVAIGIQWLAFIPAVLKRTEVFYDIVGTGTFAVLASLAWTVAALESMTDLRRTVLVALVLIWAVRLGVYLGRRIHAVGKDGRFDAIKQNTAQFFMTWTLQGLWTFLTLLPVLLIVTDKRSGPSLTWVDFVGWALWGVGMSVEVIADWQKNQFRVRGDNQNKWIDEGLWSISQHPNYFGEILLWSGLFVSGLHMYSGATWLSILSPIFVYILLTRMSGIPMLRERAQARWGSDPAYDAYLKRTRRLLPLPKKTPSLVGKHE